MASNRRSGRKNAADANASSAASTSSSATPAASTTSTDKGTGKGFTATRSQPDAGFQRRSVGEDREFGETSKEELRESGYVLPDSFFEEPVPAEHVGTIKDPANPRSKEAKARKSAAENKSQAKASDNK
jgi:hypothetical protein